MTAPTGCDWCDYGRKAECGVCAVGVPHEEGVGHEFAPVHRVPEDDGDGIWIVPCTRRPMTRRGG